MDPLPALPKPQTLIFIFIYFISFFLPPTLLIPYSPNILPNPSFPPSPTINQINQINRPSPSPNKIPRPGSPTHSANAGRSRSVPRSPPHPSEDHRLRTSPSTSAHPSFLPHYYPARLQISALRLAVPRLVPGLQDLLRPSTCLIASRSTPLLPSVRRQNDCHSATTPPVKPRVQPAKGRT